MSNTSSTHVPTAVDVLCDSRRVKVADVTYPGKHGGDETYTFVVTNPYVSVLPYYLRENADSSPTTFVVLQHAFRQAAGPTLDPTEGGIGVEGAEQAARTEMAEELGIPGWKHELEFFGYGYQQTDRGLEAMPVVGEPLQPKRARMYLAKLDWEDPVAEIHGSQMLDAEERIEPVVMELNEAITAVKAQGLKQGFSPQLLCMLQELLIRELEMRSI